MANSSTISWKNSIAAKLLRIVFSFYLILTFSVTLLHMRFEYSNEKESVINELQLLEQTYSSSLGRAIWDLNTKQLETILLGMMKFPSVAGLKFDDEYGKQIKVIGNIEGQTGVFWYEFPLSYLRKDKPIFLGKIILYSNSEVVLNEVKFSFIFIIMNAIIKTLVLWILVLVVGRIILTRPLFTLTQATANIDLNSLARTTIDLKSKERNELKILEESFNSMIKRLSLETDRIKSMTQTLQKFVPVQFLERIAENGFENIELGTAQVENITILFSDIRSFTTLSETLTPQQLLNFLNSYFTCMSKSIHQNHGFVDKFIGDAIMALFAHSKRIDISNSQDAILAAIAMLESLKLFNQQRNKDGYSSIAIGIGIHSGPTIIGTVGAENRMDSTVLGDSVNLASRLESLTKTYGANIIVSDKVLNALENPTLFKIRELDIVKVKGKTEATKIYEIFDCEPPKIQKFKAKTASHISLSLQYRKNQQWDEALSVLQTAFNLYRGDIAIQHHIEYCLLLRENPPELDWDGAIDLAVDPVKNRIKLHQKLEWTPNLSIGVESIDKQHQELFHCINQLIDALDRGKGKKQIQETLNFLGDYVAIHFQDEEELMQKFDYPDYSAHKVMHTKFIQVFQNLNRDYEARGIDLDLAFRIRSQIVNWLLGHVLKADIKIGQWLNESKKLSE